MKNLNSTVVTVAIIVAVTIIAAIIILKPTTTQEANTLVTPNESETVAPSHTGNSGLEAPTEPAPLPPATEPSSDPGDPVTEPDSPEETGPVACTMDAKQCPDGSYVGRVAPNCEFAPCPPPAEEADEPAPVACAMDVKECPDGSYVGRVAPDCEFEACPAYNPNMQLQVQP